MKIKKVQKKIAKYTKKLEKYLDLLAELTAAKEIAAEAALEKGKAALPDKPVEAPAAEQPKPTRSRRATSAKKSAAEGTPVEQPARKRRTPAKKPERASFVLYNCDEAKSPESKYNRNDETFRDSQLGRRGLWNKLKTEIAEGRIELLDNYPVRNVRLDIQSGDPVSVSQHLKYGAIEKV